MQTFCTSLKKSFMERGTGMARPNTAGMSIQELKSILHKMEEKKKALLKERREVEAQLKKINAQIASIDGAAGANLTASGRVRNEKSLVETMKDVLTKAGAAGLAVKDIMEGVKSAGYKSNADNFRGIINQTLLKEKKHFKKVERGVYAVK
jgi:hypothetical protein